MDSGFPRNRRPSDLSLYDSDYQKSDEEDLDDPECKDQRNPYERDRDKILYSRAFRRLKDVTQVARAGETYLHHDRLTHSLKVAQVGQRLSELLLSAYEDSDIPVEDHLDPSVVEAACAEQAGPARRGVSQFVGYVARDEADVRWDRDLLPLLGAGVRGGVSVRRRRGR